MFLSSLSDKNNEVLKKRLSLLIRAESAFLENLAQQLECSQEQLKSLVETLQDPYSDPHETIFSQEEREVFMETLSLLHDSTANKDRLEGSENPFQVSKETMKEPIQRHWIPLG